MVMVRIDIAVPRGFLTADWLLSVIYDIYIQYIVYIHIVFMYTILCICLYKVLKWLLSLNEMRLANNPPFARPVPLSTLRIVGSWLVRSPGPQLVLYSSLQPQPNPTLAIASCRAAVAPWMPEYPDRTCPAPPRTADCWSGASPRSSTWTSSVCVWWSPRTPRRPRTHPHDCCSILHWSRWAWQAGWRCHCCCCCSALLLSLLSPPRMWTNGCCC